MTSSPEILAPAGSREQLEASVRAGADAVYLGFGSLNARRNAANFSDNDFAGAVRYCHRRGVRVYLTMNTVVFDEEFLEAMKLLEKVCELAADAIIVQDLGLAAMIRKVSPKMPLHASTQMTIQNPAALPLLSGLGFTRVVVPRELSLEGLRAMIQAGAETGMEIEAFVHGALCMSVSGQCYLSAVLGGRSGNRGLCAQPCRLPFSSGERDHCLSLKDMSYITRINELTELGVASLKIEGRMKRPEYAALAVSACRDALAGKLNQATMDRLAEVFSRSGFTGGYLSNEPGPAMFGRRSEEDALPAGSTVYTSLHSIYKSEFPRVPVTLSLTNGASLLRLTAEDDLGNRSASEHTFDDSTELPPLSFPIIDEKLRKTGGTPYIIKDIHLDRPDENGIQIRVSGLNALRREALERLSALRERPAPIPFGSPGDEHPAGQRIGKGELRAVFHGAAQVPPLLPDGITRVYVPLETPRDELCVLYRRFGERLGVEAPRGVMGREEGILGLLRTAHGIGIGECMVHTVGLIDPVIAAGMRPYGGFGLNIANTRSLELCGTLGMTGAELSPELTRRQIASLGGELDRGIMIYGHLPVMLTRNCPVSPSDCARNRKHCVMADRRGVNFPVMCRSEFSEVFNSIPTSIVEKTGDFPSVDQFFIRFSVENSVETLEILDHCVSGSPMRNIGVTRGLFYRGVM